LSDFSLFVSFGLRSIHVEDWEHGVFNMSLSQSGRVQGGWAKEAETKESAHIEESSKVTANCFLQGGLRIHISSRVVDKKWRICYIGIVREIIHRVAELGIPLPNGLFKRSKNGSVKQNEGEHIRKVFSLNMTVTDNSKW
jgi:hypothetical protein